jgi:hypothetical protein
VKPAVVSVWRVLQIFGVICLTIVVVLTHVAETLHLFPGMGWGQPRERLPNRAKSFLNLSGASSVYRTVC